jgi:hypothetical protein
MTDYIRTHRMVCVMVWGWFFSDCRALPQSALLEKQVWRLRFMRQWPLSWPYQVSHATFG